jgi:hypothetical protein
MESAELRAVPGATPAGRPLRGGRTSRRRCLGRRDLRGAPPPVRWPPVAPAPPQRAPPDQIGDPDPRVRETHLHRPPAGAELTDDNSADSPGRIPTGIGVNGQRRAARVTFSRWTVDQGRPHMRACDREDCRRRTSRFGAYGPPVSPRRVCYLGCSGSSWLRPHRTGDTYGAS